MITAEFSTGEYIDTDDPLRIGGMVKEEIRQELESLLKEGFGEDKAVTREAFDAVLRCEYRSVCPIFVYYVNTEKMGLDLVAYGELHVLTTALGKYGFIENIVVKKSFRGCKLGMHVMQKLITAARHMHLNNVELTSATHRVEAHALYKKLGFRTRDTNVFELDLT